MRSQRQRSLLLIGGHAGPDSMEKHVLEAFNELGWRSCHFDCRQITGLTPKFDQAMYSLLRLGLREPERIREFILLRTIERLEPSLILVLLGNRLSPKTVKKIRERFKIPIVVWCQDSITTWDRQYLIGAEYDHFFMKDYYMVEILRDMAGFSNIHYLPEACNPRVHRTVELNEVDRLKYSAEIMTYGSLYYYRQAILTVLKDFDLKVWGKKPDWLVDQLPGRYMGRSIYEIEKSKAVLSSSIALNTLHYAEIRGLNARAFEIAGIGGFQLMTDSPVAKEHFVVGEEIETFSSREELLEKVQYYLKEPDKRKAIGIAGQRRAYSEHTYTHRIKTLLEVTGVR